MKENELPEKIFLSYEPDEDYNDNIFIDYMWHIHPFDGKNLKNIEYTRTDTFIDKAYKYLFENYHGEKLSLRMIEDFKKYMKGE